MPRGIDRIGPKKPLGDEVYEALKTAILQGELAGGARLIEEQLAERLGASRTPVRQAMHMLERESLVQRQSRGGFVVRRLSAQDATEILDLRCALESFAARLAAGNITDESLEMLKSRHAEFGRAIGGPVETLVRLNTEFHEALYGLSGNRRLHQLIHDLRDHFYRYRVTLLRLRDMARTSHEDHRQMIAAMEARDQDLTENLVREHILKGKELVLREVRRLDRSEKDRA